MRRPWLARPVLLGCGLFVASGVMADAADRSHGPTPSVTSPARVAEPARSGELVRATLDKIDVLEPGTSDRRSLEGAQATLPLDRLTPQNRQRAEAVLSGLSMFRQMPTVRLDVDHEVYRFFLDHPDIAVSVWRALDVSKCQLWQTGPDSYETDIGDGSIGVVDVLYRGPNDHLIVGEGRFKSPLLVKPIRATALLHLHTDYVTRPDGTTETICRGYLYAAFPSQTVETAAKVISPVTNMVIDRNFEEIGLFAHMMSMAMRTQPGWVENLAGRLDGVLERHRAELLQVTARAYVAEKKRTLTREGLPVSAETIVPTRRR